MLAGLEHLELFVVAGLLLNLTPGPDVLYILTHAGKSGWRAGALAALGIAAGCFVHIAAATAGLSAVLAASGSAFALLKWIGAAYLVYVGWGMLGLGRRDGAPVLAGAGCARAADEPSAPDLGATAAQGYSAKRVFIQGFWSNVLNPKVALFFLAFLPQFIAPGAQHPAMAFLLLGLLFNFNGLWVNLGYAALAATLSRRLVRTVRFSGAPSRSLRWIERLAGAAFVALGLKLALSDNPLG